MGNTIAIGFLAATLYVAPLEAQPANPLAPALTKPNNDATLRPPHRPPLAPPTPLQKTNPPRLISPAGSNDSDQGPVDCGTKCRMQPSAGRNTSARMPAI